MPEQIKYALDEFQKQNDRHSIHKYTHYYILNYSAKHLKQQDLVDKNMSRVRINFAPHAYLYPNARHG